MPVHKGIKLSVISQWELKIHPEFPHPDSSQFTFRSPDVNKHGHISSPILCTPPSASSESKADRLLGRKSTVSVYIPSLSGSRFWIRYTITDAIAAESKFYYFKMYMNGRNITSWGVDAKIKPSGQVMKALFDPSERWNYKDGGIVYKNNGIESRPFFFATEEQGRSAANDGGLIEVLVFRAKGRRRVVSQPVQFRNQERYGIVMPSGGLLDKPQDARFYDWHLSDPKDNPYATFRFHYRSWDHLESLQLIPQSHPRTLIPATPSLLEINGQPSALQAELEDEEDEDWELDSASSTDSPTPWMTNVFDYSPKHVQTTEEGVESSPSQRTFPLHVSRGFPFSNISATASQQQGETRQSLMLDRPLPAIPFRKSSLKRSPTSSEALHSPPTVLSRKSSVSSYAPSITPSLREYSNQKSPSPEPIFGIAKVVPVLRPAFDEISFTEEASVSSIEPDLVEHFSQLWSPSATPSKRTGSASPPSRLDLPPTVTLRKHQISPKRQFSPSKVPKAGGNGVEVGNEQDTFDNSTTLSLTESEWMCKTPSPMKNKPQLPRNLQLWSPKVQQHKEASALKMNGTFSYEEMKSSDEEAFDENSPLSSRFDGNVKIKGNWI